MIINLIRLRIVLTITW